MKKITTKSVSVILAIFAGVVFAYFSPGSGTYINDKYAAAYREYKKSSASFPDIPLCSVLEPVPEEEFIEMCFSEEGKVFGFPFRVNSSQSTARQAMYSAANFAIGSLSVSIIAYILLSKIHNRT